MSVGGAPGVVVCEAGVRWAAAWRRVDAVSVLRNVASLHDCVNYWRASPASVFVIDACVATANGILAAISSRPRGSFLILAGESALLDARWRWMECGADWVVNTERELPLVCGAARRHLRRWQPTTMTIEARVRATLPWGG
jgi:hypothetical protein